MKKNQYQTVKGVGVALMVAALTFTSIILWRQAFQADGDVLSSQRISNAYGGFGYDFGVDKIGYTVADIGDLNGDGVRDLAVGAYGDDSGGTDRGAVYILFLDADGTIDDINGYGRGLKKISDIDGGFTAPLDDSDFFGASVASIGDVNGDGVNDLAVGATGDDDGALSAGAVYVLFMDTDGTVDDTTGYAKISATNGQLTGSTISGNDEFGISVAGLGDLNGDGVEDIAVGSEFDDSGATNAGAVTIIFLDADGTVNTTAGAGGVGFVTISKSTASLASTILARDQFGSGLASIGDFNADGVVDLAVGAEEDDLGSGNASGALYILYLDTDGSLDDANPFIKIGEGLNGFTGALDAGDRFGTSVTNLGDLNGDGIVDLAVGTPGDDDGATSNGAVYILFFDADGTLDDTTNHAKISTTSGGTICSNSASWFGSAVAKMTDYNGDGIIELAVGSPNHYVDTGERQGAVCILHLDADGTVDDTDGFDPIDSDSNVGFGSPLNRQSNFGSAVADIGDLNGDGISDLAVGAQGEARVYILFLDADGTLDDTTPWARIGENEGGFTYDLSSNSYFGSAVAALGDLNSDGVEDIIVGARSASEAYVLFLDADGTLDDTAGQSGAGYTRIASGSGDWSGYYPSSSYFGYSVANIGDVNNDGVVDVVIGSPEEDTGGTNAGTVTVLFLDTDGTLKDGFTPKFITENVNGFTAVLDTTDNFGNAVAGLGDLNGDGVEDIAVGSWLDDDGTTNNGAVYIVFLDEDGTADDSDPFAKISDTDGDFTATLGSSSVFGLALANVGDINGDNIVDLAVSARYTNALYTVMFILYLDEDGTVDDTLGYKLFDRTVLTTAGYFGESIVGMTDMNSDGIKEIVTGNTANTDGTIGEGGLYTLFMEGTVGGDLTAPTVSSGTITETGDTDTSIALSWTAATDETSAQGALVYKVYRGADGVDLSTVSNAESNGTLVDTLTGTTTKTVTSLSPETEYEFNVVVQDEAGNKTAYTALSANTDPTPDTTSPTVSSGTITETGETDTTLTFSWTQATDLGTAQEALTYKIYSAVSGADLDSIADTEANGTLKTTVTGAGSGTISGLSELTTYEINIIVSDAAGNKSLYTQMQAGTGATPDTTPPVPGGSGTLQRSSATSNTVTVLWTQATDDETAQSSLVYGLYYATAGTDMDSVADTEANGTRYSGEFTSLNSLRVTGLTANTSYTFQLLVRDASGNKAVYTQLLGSFTTATASSVPALSFPANTIVAINEGMECTNTRDVTIDIQGANVDRVVIADDNRFLGSIWELFTGSPMRRSYTLADKEGEQTVYVIFRSWHGNKSFIHSDSIVYRPNDEACTYVATEVEGTTTTTEETVAEEQVTTETAEIGISDLVTPDSTTTTTTDSTTTTTTTSPSTGTTTTTTTDTSTGATTTETAPTTTTTTTTSPSAGTATTTTTTSPTAPTPSANVPRDAIVRLGNTNQYFYVDKTGSKRYPVAEFYIALTWVDPSKIQTIQRKDLITIPVDNSLVLAPKPGTLILAFGGKEYWLEPSPDGNPLTPVARELSSQTLIRDIFGKSWNKYRLILTDAQTKGIVIGPAILDRSQVTVDPTTLRTVAELRRLAK